MSEQGEQLRAAYENFAATLSAGGFGAAPDGEWDARQTAGHVTTNAELVTALMADVAAGRPARLNGPDDHAPQAINRYDGLDWAEIAETVRQTADTMVGQLDELSAEQHGTSAEVFIKHYEQVVVDGPMTVDELIGAEIGTHVPAHVEQLTNLRTSG